jgi:hypothetical protein
LTVALAFIGAHLKNAEDYLLKKTTICNAVRALVCAIVASAPGAAPRRPIRKHRSNSMPPMRHLTASI